MKRLATNQMMRPRILLLIGAQAGASVLPREAVTPAWIHRTGAGSIRVLAEIRP
jgi:hypothetical protein